MTPTIRDAAAADARAIRAVADRAWRVTYAGLFERSFIELVLERTYAIDQLEAAIAEPGTHFLVAVEGDRVIGYLQYTAAELTRLYVDPDHIGGGAGSLLLAELERRLDPGTEYVALVRAGNDRAVAFYLNRGFEKVKQVDGFGRFAEAWGLELPAGGDCDLLMRRRLPFLRS